MLKYLIFIVIFFLPNFCFSQTFESQNVKDSFLLKDRLDFIKAKKRCHIGEYQDTGVIIDNKRIGAYTEYTFWSPDHMLYYSESVYDKEIVWTLTLKAYGNIWTHEAKGIEAITELGHVIKLPDVPISVDYDKEKKLYLYTASLSAREPFENTEEQDIAKDIDDILTCKIYRLYVFEHLIKEQDFMEHCSGELYYRTLSLEDRYKVKKGSK